LAAKRHDNRVPAPHRYRIDPPSFRLLPEGQMTILTVETKIHVGNIG
jgi:hypothetical protein